MHDPRTAEVLYETEAALRLVDRGLEGLRDEDDDALADLLAQAQAQLLAALDHLRDVGAASGPTARAHDDASPAGSRAHTTSVLLDTERHLAALARVVDRRLAEQGASR